MDDKPLPIQHSSVAIFTFPTGALTDIKISFSLAILVGLVHQVDG